MTVTTFPIPVVQVFKPQGIATGSDGDLWFTESAAGRIGKMTASGALTEFKLPLVPSPSGSAPGAPDVPPTPDAIAAGPDGALWFTTTNSEIGRITTAGTVTMFPIDGLTSSPTDIVVGPDGALWFTGVSGEVGRITTSGVVSEFLVPPIPPPTGSVTGTAATPATLTAIATGSDGALWFTGEPGTVGRITTSGVVTGFPDPESDTSNLPTIVNGPDGNLWVTTGQGTSGVPVGIGRMTPSGAFTAFTVPGDFSNLGGLTVGPDGNLWFTEQEDGQTHGQQPALGEITPAGVTTLHPLPPETTLDSNQGVPVNPGSITAGPDGALWFTENDAIGRITTDGALQQFPLTLPGATADSLTSGRVGTIWFDEKVSSSYNYAYEYSVGRISTGGAITDYPLPAGTNVSGMTEDRRGNLWFLDDNADPEVPKSPFAIGRVTTRGSVKLFPVRLPRGDQHPTVDAIATGPGGRSTS